MLSAELDEKNDTTQVAPQTQPETDGAPAGSDAPTPPPPPPSPTPPKGPRIGKIAMFGVVLAVGVAGGVWLNPSVRSLLNLDASDASSGNQSGGGGGGSEMAGMPGMPGMAGIPDKNNKSDMKDMKGMEGMEGMSASTDAQQPSQDDSSSKIQFYTCGMHPWVILPDPGKCPIGGMDLVPLDPNKFTGQMSIDPVVSQNIGVRVKPITQGPVVRTIRTIGTIAYDETRVRDINIKASGWIEKLYVDYEGAEVKKGDPLFDLYSPKIYSAQTEYLTSLKMRGKVGVNFLPDSQLDSERLIRDSRVQLEYYDITPKQIDALETAGVASKTMTIYSPIKGVVIAKHANEGMPVTLGARPYQIADLSRVWVMVSLYEYQLPFVELGQPATMTLPYIPGQAFQGRVIYIYPYLDETTRQVSVRLEFDNPNFLLKPGMYASVDLKNTIAKKRTLAPRSAIIDTGERKIAFVSLGDGKFEPRKILLGAKTDNGMVEILDGLKPGEQVVTSGQFLLDSESRVRESLAKMIRGDLPSDQASGAAASEDEELISLPAPVRQGVSDILTNYFLIGDQLAADLIDNIGAPAGKIASAVDTLLTLEIPNNDDFWNEHDEITTVQGKASMLIDIPSIEEARLAYADLSVSLAKFLKATGVPPELNLEVQELHCPMFKEGQSGSIWLQDAGDVRNPFLGQTMPQCFDKRSSLQVMKDAR